MVSSESLLQCGGVRSRENRGSWEEGSGVRSYAPFQSYKYVAFVVESQGIELG